MCSTVSAQRTKDPQELRPLAGACIGLAGVGCLVHPNRFLDGHILSISARIIGQNLRVVNHSSIFNYLFLAIGGSLAKILVSDLVQQTEHVTN